MGLKPCLLIYDIPDRSRVRNPSGRLRRRAVRVNLSCWVIPEAEVPYNLLNEMAEGGAEWHVVRFADDELKKLTDMAHNAIEKQVKEAEKRAVKCAERAAVRAVNAGLSSDAVARIHADTLVAATTRAQVLLQELQEAAKVFGVSAGIDIESACAAINVVQKSARERARVYAEATQEAERVGSRLVEAAREDLVPAGMLHDDIEERGGTTRIRETFWDE